MDKVSYHTHSSISDGELSPRDLIELAIERGFRILAITDHYPRPKEFDFFGWSAGFYSDEDYEKLKKLQKEYEGKIEILVGAEFEWFPNNKDWLYSEVNKRDYDIKIISAHQIFVKEKVFTINYKDKMFKDAFDAFGGDAKKIVGAYYKNLRDAISSGWFDIVAHLDLIKTFNKNSKYFSEKEDWYKEEVFETLRAIKKAGLKMEVNLQGFFVESLGEQWPSKWIIDEARNMEIELVVSTDAHNELQLDYDVDEVKKLLS